MTDDVRVNDELTIPGHELEWRFSMASGPGGQNVHTNETRVELRWSVGASKAVTEVQRYRLLEHLRSRLTDDGLLRIAVETERSQHQNRVAATERLVHLVREGLRHETARYRTDVPPEVREERLHDKHHHAEIKQLRRDPSPDELDPEGFEPAS